MGDLGNDDVSLGPVSVSPFRAGFACRCPRCGRGKLFNGCLEVAESCANCGLDIADHDTGDGPAVFVILIVGFAIVAAALIVEIKFGPPLWLHLVVWIPLILALSLGLLRILKSLLVALRYYHQAGEQPPAS